MHRQSSVALVCCFIVAMGLLVAFTADAPPKQVAAAPVTPPPVETANASYTGNIKTKKFHRLSCRYAGCTNCVAKFASREEAIQAGFDPCGVCDP